MRLSPLATIAGSFGLAIVLSFAAAKTVAGFVEEVSAHAVAAALTRTGHDWASVQADGLQVVLEGEAPSEAARFSAISAAGQVVDASRVIDAMAVAATAPLAAPDFEVEILRNDTGLSLIGLIPTATDRDRLQARIADAADGQPVSDFLETGDYPAPESWEDALDFALRAVQLLPQSKISVSAEQVSVTAIAASEASRREIEDKLAGNRPEGVEVAMADQHAAAGDHAVHHAVPDRPGGGAPVDLRRRHRGRPAADHRCGQRRRRRGAGRLPTRPRRADRPLGRGGGDRDRSARRAWRRIDHLFGRRRLARRGGGNRPGDLRPGGGRVAERAARGLCPRRCAARAARGRGRGSARLLGRPDGRGRGADPRPGAGRAGQCPGRELCRRALWPGRGEDGDPGGRQTCRPAGRCGCWPGSRRCRTCPKARSWSPRKASRSAARPAMPTHRRKSRG